MKKKVIPYSIILIFLIIFAVFYKSLKDTNIYTPETKINNDIPIFSADFLLLNENSTSTEIFELISKKYTGEEKTLKNDISIFLEKSNFIIKV